MAAGRNERVLSTLLELGADATIRLDKPDQELIEAFRRETAEKSFDVIIDYLWGSDGSSTGGPYKAQNLRLRDRRLDWWRWARARDRQSSCPRQCCGALR